MSDVQRYLRCARSGDMIPDSLGAWCRHDDADAEIERLRELVQLLNRSRPDAEIERLGRELADINAGWQRTYDHDTNRLKASIAEQSRDLAKIEGVLEQEKQEHNICTTLHALAVKERNYERTLAMDKDTEIERLRDALVIANTTAANLHEEIEQLRVDMDARHWRTVRAEAEVAVLKVNVERMRGEYEDLDGLRHLACDQRDDYRKEVERLRGLLRDARADVKELADQQTKRHRIEQYKQQLSEIDEALS